MIRLGLEDLQKKKHLIGFGYSMLVIIKSFLFFQATDDSYQLEIGKEDDYDQQQTLFSSLISHMSHSNIKEVWKVIRHRALQAMPQYVIVLDDGSHLCTCLWLINRGIVCRHFFKVMSYSQSACFHITLIPQR